MIQSGLCSKLQQPQLSFIKGHGPTLLSELNFELRKEPDMALHTQTHCKREIAYTPKSLRIQEIKIQQSTISPGPIPSASTLLLPLYD